MRAEFEDRRTFFHDAVDGDVFEQKVFHRVRGDAALDAGFLPVHAGEADVFEDDIAQEGTALGCLLLVAGGVHQLEALLGVFGVHRDVRDADVSDRALLCPPEFVRGLG